MPNCVLCPNLAGESHHIFPVHLGGDIKGPQTPLCEICHAKIHYVSGRIYKGKAYDVDADWFRRAKFLIMRIVKAKIDAETADLSGTLSRIILKVSKGKLRLIHRRKKDLGFSNMENYLMALIDRDLRG